MSAGALAAIFGSSFLVSLTGALSPGPLTTMAIREGARQGFWAGPLLATGHGAIELLLVVGLALGLDRVLERTAVAASVALLGGFFLLGLGWHTLATAPRRELVMEGAGQGPQTRPPSLAGQPTSVSFVALPTAQAGLLVAAGAAVSVGNPFWVVWWATVGTAYIAEALKEGAAGVVSFYGAHFLTDLGWLSLIAFLLARGRRLVGGRAYRGLLLACGVFLLALGAWFLTSGFGYIY